VSRAKIEPSHLDRNAYVYVRQSTKHQVEHHLESQQRQYELKQRAVDLGWQSGRVIVIDDDLGSSASGRADRAGFERLVSYVALGRAGIVLGLEVSRLARNNRDWYGLLDLCAVKQTLIGDADGVYDPSLYNDRLLLGLKGTMSEAELHLIKSRMLAGLRHKAAKGELKFMLPAGYEFDDMGLMTKTSDEEVANFIALVFGKMLEQRSVSAVHRDLVHDGLRFPSRNRSDGSIRWVTPYYRAVYLMLLNPIYAGTYAWGRSKVVTEIAPDGSRKTRQRPKSVAQWEVILHDHHPAYISRQDFERIQRMVEQNRPAARTEASAAVREGVALLQGIVRCGRCGRSMTVRYHTSSSGNVVPSYVCVAAKAQNRGGDCQSVSGRRIENTVSQIFLEAMSPGQLEIHVAALSKLNQHQDAVANQLELQVERARYEAGRLERQYNSVEPENRVVARRLETRWNEALAHVEELEQQLTDRRNAAAAQFGIDEERRLRELCLHLPKLWVHKRVTNRERKMLLRAALDEVLLRKEGRSVDVKILWKGGAVTETRIAIPQLPPGKPAPSNLAALIRELATRFDDAQIARVLLRRGIKTQQSKVNFTARHVADFRRRHEIPPCPDASQDGLGETYTVEQAARLFNVSPPTIYSWLNLGVLVGEQITPGAPWAIAISEADRRRLVAHVPPGWRSIDDAAAELAVSKQTILNWVKAKKVRYAYVTHGRRRGLRIDVKSAPQRRQGRLLD
jgi:DNA invertase Pin-like site-specific DNA recombinase/transposase